MSDVRPDIDLGGLTRPSSSIPPPRRRWSRIVVPAVILLAFVAVLASSLGDVLRGAVEVTVVRPSAVAADDASHSASSSTALFQAAGWVEPDPFPIQVTALASGVVREIAVRESDTVQAGDVIVRLVDDDAKLALKSAEAALAKAQAEREKAALDVTLAREIFQHALAVTEMLATAKAEAAGRTAESTRRAAALEKSGASIAIAREELGLQRELAKLEAAGPRQVELAEARLKEAESSYESLAADAAAAKAAAESAAAKLVRAEAEAVLRFEDRDRSGTADTRLAFADAALAEAHTSYETAKLRLARMSVRAPADGVVLERLVVPGSILETGAAGAAVCSLYDPHSLRVRVDVPQSDVVKVSAGARAEITAETRAGKPYRGEVLRVVHKADIQKVTLQVHVRVLDADLWLRPEMLCQVRFFGGGERVSRDTPASVAGARDDTANTPDAKPSPANGGATLATDEPRRAAERTESGSSGMSDVVRIPARLVIEGSSVWIVDGEHQTASRRAITVGARDTEWVEVVSGLNVTDKLIDEGRDRVRAGSRVRVRGGN